MNASRAPILLLLISLVFLNREGWAMSKHIHYVDKNAPNKVYNEEPFGEGTRRVIKGDFYEVVVNFPQEHREKGWPGKQWAHLSVDGMEENPIEYRILKYEILYNGMNQINKIDYGIESQKIGYRNLEEVIGRKYQNHGSRAKRFTAFTSIPPAAEEIQISIEIEITSSKGEKALVKESIPLKRSYYKTSFWEGLRP